MDLNRAQRVVIVIGWGLVLATLASTLSAELAPGLGEDDWFNYAPNEGVLGSSSGPSWGGALVWLVAVAVWTASSLLVLRSSRSTPRPGRPPHDGDPS